MGVDLKDGRGDRVRFKFSRTSVALRSPQLRHALLMDLGGRVSCRDPPRGRIDRHEKSLDLRETIGALPQAGK